MKLTGGLGGIGRWPPISTLGRNCPHGVESIPEVRKFLLNLVLGEPLALVKELAYLDKSI